VKALVKAQAEPGLWLQDVEAPAAGINDVLIRVHRTGICGTDLHIYAWDAWARRTIPVPMVIGHEFVGEVADVGSNVNDFKTGDLVSGEGHLVCGRCRNCMAGRRHLCAHTKGVGVDRAGAFAEYVALPMTNVWHHGDGIDPEVAAIFDPFGNAVHTALAFPVLGEDVLITGAGPIGMMAAAVVRHAGARHVVITDVNQHRLALARHMGATRTVDVRAEPLAEVQAGLGMQEGFDVGLEMSGDPAALRDMLANMAHGGRVALLGIPTDEIADGVFSMDGQVAPLREICELADHHDAMVMVDDSHAVGVLSPTGRGTHELRDVMDRVDMLTGTLGKALGGASGGYVAAAARSWPYCDSARGRTYSRTPSRRPSWRPRCECSTYSRAATGYAAGFTRTRPTSAKASSTWDSTSCPASTRSCPSCSATRTWRPRRPTGSSPTASTSSRSRTLSFRAARLGSARRCRPRTARRTSTEPLRRSPRLTSRAEPPPRYGGQRAQNGFSTRTPP